MTCQQCCGFEQQFDAKVARRDLKNYRRKGAKKTTSRLLDLIRRSGIEVESLLDIGGGIGAIQHAMAEQGASQITSVDASASYLEAAKSESKRKGYADRATYISGNFVEAAEQIDQADLVTLDRVVCCYHDVDALLGTAVNKARRAVGLVFPRDNVIIRLGVATANRIQRVLRRDFQAFVHPHTQIERILSDRGFEHVGGGHSLLWRIALYTKSK